MVACRYAHGPSVTTIAAWSALREGTVFRRFDRLEAEPIAEGVRDAPRPRRPPKPSTDQREAFEVGLRELPRAHGVDDAKWTMSVART